MKLIAITVAATAAIAAVHYLSTGIILATITLVGAATATALWHRIRRSSALITRWSRLNRKRHGVATGWQVAANTLRIRRRATAIRPHLDDHPIHRRALVPMSQLGIPLVKVAWQKVWATFEDVVLLVGAPRSGKTQWMAGRIISAPGACVVTSTKLDLYRITSPLRSKTGPVWVFNPSGVGNLPNTLRFDPLTGCSNPRTAKQRATDMVRAGGGGEGLSNGDFWRGQAERILSTFIHAASLDGRVFGDVYAWISDPKGHKQEIRLALAKAADTSYLDTFEQFIDSAPATATSTSTTIMPALDWLLIPTARAAVEGGKPLDVAEMLRERATIYLVGSEESSTAPLVTALTGHIASEAKRIADTQPGERLDPPLTMALDEAALICPVPLAQWTADMGGRGIPIIIAIQSKAQLVSRYGESDAAVIINNAASVMLLGGSRDAKDLEYWSTLTGRRDEQSHSRNTKGRKTGSTERATAVIETSQLANLKPGYAVVVHRGMPPAVGRIEQARKRRDVKAAKRQARRADRAVVRTAETVTASFAVTSAGVAQRETDHVDA